MPAEPLTLADFAVLTPAQLRIVALDAAGHVAPLLPDPWRALLRRAWLVLGTDAYEELQWDALSLPRPLPGDHGLNYARAAVLWALQSDGDAADVLETCRAAGDVAFYQGRGELDCIARCAAEWDRQRAVVAAFSGRESGYVEMALSGGALLLIEPDGTPRAALRIGGR